MSSDKEKYALGASTLAEALVNQWYAYAYTMAPAAASLHLVNHQLPILESYLDAPNVHARAIGDKTLLGAPFAAIPVESAHEVQALRNEILCDQRETLAFAKAYLSLDELLDKDARGQSIESFYAKMQPALRGLCELGYDYRNHPAIRVIEPLVYRSAMARERRESWLLSRQEVDGQRPFFLSTPRLASSGVHHWETSFNDPRVDEFFSLEHAPRPLGEIAELLNLDATDGHRLVPLLERRDERIPAEPSWQEPRVRIRYFGHACLLIEYAGFSILTDPNISTLPAEGGVARLSYRDLPESIDFVLLTHSHADHFLPEVLMRLRRRIRMLLVPRNHDIFIGDPSLRLLAGRLGIPVSDLDPLDAVPVPHGQIVAIPFLGEHCDLFHAKTAFLVRLGKNNILVLADSNCLDAKLYENIRHEFGSVDAAFLGMECDGAPLTWQYGALLPKRPSRDIEQGRRLNGCDARAATALLSAIDAKRVYIYAMGREPWLEYLMALAPKPDSVQMREAEAALRQAAARGSLHQENLFAKFELVL